MTNLATPLLIALSLFLFFMYGTPDAQLVTVNGIAARDMSTVVSLTNSQDDLTSGFYDSFEIPRGTDYQVPAGHIFYITHLEGEPGNSGGLEQIKMGYSAVAVNNQELNPAASSIMFDVTLDATAAVSDHAGVFVPVPGGMYP